MWRNTSKGVQCVKPTKSTCTTRNHTCTPSQQTQKHNHLKSLLWTSSQSFPHQKDTTQSSPLWTMIAPRRLCSSLATKLSPVKESQNYTYNTRTLTMVSPKD